MSVDFYRAKKSPMDERSRSMTIGGAHINITDAMVKNCALRPALQRLVKELLKTYKYLGVDTPIVGISLNTIGLTFILGEPKKRKVK
jgi:hypothetical protein